MVVVPESTFDMEGYVRIGYANSPDILTAGLERLSDYLANMNRAGNPKVA